MYEYTARFVSITDADTIVVDIDLGFRVWWNAQKLRLLGLDAPERNTEEGKVAIAFTTQWFVDHGTIFTIRTFKDKSDSFGRWLAYIIAKDGAILNSDLLSSGNAKVY